jgi:hypothetical protein
MRTLVDVALDVGWQLEHMREHPLFEAMVEIYSQDQVRRWLLLDALPALRLTGSVTAACFWWAPSSSGCRGETPALAAAIGCGIAGAVSAGMGSHGTRRAATP